MGASSQLEGKSALHERYRLVLAYCRLHRACPGNETVSLAVAQRALPSRSTTHQISYFCLGKCDVICNIVQESYRGSGPRGPGEEVREAGGLTGNEAGPHAAGLHPSWSGCAQTSPGQADRSLPLPGMGPGTAAPQPAARLAANPAQTRRRQGSARLCPSA